MFRQDVPNPTGSNAVNAFMDHIRSDRCRYRTDYGRTIRELEKVVPSGDFLVSFYENLFGPGAPGPFQADAELLVAQTEFPFLWRHTFGDR
jgi:hypothetical protein